MFLGRRIRNTGKEKRARLLSGRYLIKYTVIFLAVSAVVLGFYFINGKTLVFSGDGYKQHYKALLYYSQWVREIIRNFISTHTLAIPSFSLSMGLGSDVLTTLQYYVIGDPFCLFCFLVPSGYILYYYEFMIVFRLYCAGLAFSAFVLNRKKTPDAALAGAVVYVFCSYSIYAGSKHPYFSNPLVFLPLLLLGVDKYRREQKPGILMAVVAVSEMSNFYFFYMLVILVIAYVMLESFVPFKREKFKKEVFTIFRIGGYSFIGVLAGAILFLPIVLTVLSDARTDSGYELDLFYSASYYKKFFQTLMTSESGGSWTYVGVSAAAILAVFLLFRRGKSKGRLRLKIAYFAAVIAMLLPAAGYAFSGFSYCSNRWSFGFVMITSCILTEMWPDLFRLTKKDIVYLSGCMGLYFIVCSLASHEVSDNYYFSFIVASMALLALVIARVGPNEKPQENGSECSRKAQIVFACFLVAGVCGNAFYLCSAYAGNWAGKFKDSKWFQEEFNDTEADAVKAVAGEDNFYRYSGGFIVENASLFSGLSNTQIYWSLTNSNVTNLYEQTLVSLFAGPVNHLKGFDSRTILEELASVQYFTKNSGGSDDVPYGYELVYNTAVQKSDGSVSRYWVWENKYSLPLGYTYSSAISEEQAAVLSPLEKQETMLSAVILEDGENLVQTSSGWGEDMPQEVEYELKCDSDYITENEGSFIVTAPDQSVTLTFKGLANAETYLSVSNLQFSGIKGQDLYENNDSTRDSKGIYGTESPGRPPRQTQKMRGERYSEPSRLKLFVTVADSDGTVSDKRINFQTPRFQWYNNRKDVLLNLGYSETTKTSVTITFPKRGTYSFDDIKILCQSMDGYEEKINALKEDVLEQVDLHENGAFATNRITGSISLDEPKILCLSIPYSDGWTAFVDGQETKIHRANYAYMGLELEPGDHQIELVYHTPGLKEGALVSAAGLLAALVLARMRRKKKYNL